MVLAVRIFSPLPINGNFATQLIRNQEVAHRRKKLNIPDRVQLGNEPPQAAPCRTKPASGFVRFSPPPVGSSTHNEIKTPNTQKNNAKSWKLIARACPCLHFGRIVGHPTKERYCATLQLTGDRSHQKGSRRHRFHFRQFLLAAEST